MKLFCNFTGRVGSGQEVFKLSRVGSRHPYPTLYPTRPELTGEVSLAPCPTPTLNWNLAYYFCSCVINSSITGDHSK